MGDAATTEDAWQRTRRFIAGYFSGCALVLAGHPFDTIKVRVQTESTGRFKGPIDCLVQTVRKEGPLAIYKGVLPPLLATGVINSVLFGMQGAFAQRIADYNQRDDPTVMDISQAAVVSGAIMSVAVGPMERTKARMQVNYDSGKGKATVSSVFREFAASRGGFVRNLYAGWVPTALCRMSNYAYFGSYALIKQSLAKIAPPSASVQGSFSNLLLSVCGGGLAGICYWLSCYPLDVIKNRMQAAPGIDKYSSMLTTSKLLYQEGGLRAFGRGFMPCALRAFPANAACFVAYEIVISLLPERI
eukprot:m.82338 g.82338  ORF g.82338 m.82338 type:complete len:302 (+) comp12685_c0_seq3:225-1130(+)